MWHLPDAFREKMTPIEFYRECIPLYIDIQGESEISTTDH